MVVATSWAVSRMPSDVVEPVLMPSVIAVRTNSGQIATTRMSWVAHSRSRASLRPRTANLVAL